jgi:flagellar motor switch/type III secretory pathway protein FliN
MMTTTMKELRLSVSGDVLVGQCKKMADAYRQAADECRQRADKFRAAEKAIEDVYNQMSPPVTVISLGLTASEQAGREAANYDDLADIYTTLSTYISDGNREMTVGQLLTLGFFDKKLAPIPAQDQNQQGPQDQSQPTPVPDQNQQGPQDQSQPPPTPDQNQPAPAI